MRDFLAEIYNESKLKRKYSEVPKFPSVLRDISFVVPEDINSKEINNVLGLWNNKSMKSFRVFDYYPLQSGKSYSYTFEFCDDTKTLTDEEVNRYQDQLIDYLGKKINAEVRR